MMSLFIFLIFAGVTASFWFQGLWNSITGAINIIFAGLIATAYYEPLCDLIDGSAPGFTFLIDYLVLWGLFAFAYLLLRAIGDGISKNVLIFHPHVELGGRSVAAALAGWIFTCFAAFSLQLAPLEEYPLGSWKSPSFSFTSPSMVWASLAHHCSIGSLSRGKFSDMPQHTDDVSANVQAFDSLGEFPFRAHDRRARFTKLEGLRND